MCRVFVPSRASWSGLFQVKMWVEQATTPGSRYSYQRLCWQGSWSSKWKTSPSFSAWRTESQKMWRFIKFISYCSYGMDFPAFCSIYFCKRRNLISFLVILVTKLLSAKSKMYVICDLLSVHPFPHPVTFYSCSSISWHAKNCNRVCLPTSVLLILYG